MTGTESQILKLIGELREAGPGSVARKMRVSEEYVAEICQALLQDGYLTQRSGGLYALTPKAEKATSPVRSIGPIAVLKGGSW